MANEVSFWGAAYQLPIQVQLFNVRAAAAPAGGFAVFGASGSAQVERPGFGDYETWAPAARMAVFGNVLDLLDVRELLDDEGARAVTPDMQNLRVHGTASGFALLSTPGSWRNGVGGSFDSDTSAVFQTFGADGRSTSARLVLQHHSGDNIGTQLDFQPRPGGGWYASFGSTQRAWVLLASDGAVQAGPFTDAGFPLAATALPDGRILRFSNGVGGQASSGQLYSASGVAQGDPIDVVGTAAVGLGSGAIAVFWSDGGDVYGQVLSATGATESPSFAVAAVTAGPQQDVTVEALPDGGCLVFWESYPEDPDPYNGGAPDGVILAQRFDAAGRKAGTPFEVMGSVAQFLGRGIIDTFSFGDGRVGLVIDPSAAQGDLVVQVVDTRGRTHTGSEAADTIVGSSGGTTISGLGGNDQLYGFDGNDLVDGGSGDDTLTGAGAHDTLVGAEGNDQLSGGEGNDWLIAGGGADVLHGDAGTDVLVGADGNDSLFGGDGFDYLYGGTGSNVLMGGGGTDVVISEGVNDVVHSGAGSDMVYLYGSGTSTVTNESGNDVLVVVGGSVVALTGGGQDYVYGGAGSDWISSGGGVDVLVGGGGSDTFHGGAGVDYLFLGAGPDTLLHDLQSGVDVVNGFDPARDVIALQGTGLGSFAQVQAATSDFGSFLVVTIDAATAVWLVGVRPEQLSASNFVFE
ncbi:MAG TPA: calcium-binding protein [Ramlibacter sp.]|jgi:Ca2+-binding RTX toxin-like protein|nr:calcium-binding protein [Ramlibacter sp.]